MKADQNGVAEVCIEDSIISLCGDHSIIGRTMVVSVHIRRICIKLLLTHGHICFHDFMIISPGF